jgi:hypothetical protein
MLNNIKCTTFCYTQELIDALVEVNTAAENMKETEEAKKYRQIRSAFMDIDTKLPGPKKELDAAREYVETMFNKFCKTESDAYATYKEKVANVCKILQKMLNGKFVVLDNGWITHIVHVKTVACGGYFDNDILAYGDKLELNLLAPKPDAPYGVSVWNLSNSISTVANVVAQHVNEGKTPVAAEGTVIQMFDIVDPDDAIAWLNERKKTMDDIHNYLIDTLNAAKQG